MLSSIEDKGISQINFDVSGQLKKSDLENILNNEDPKKEIPNNNLNNNKVGL